MIIYKNSTTKYCTPAFDKLSSFDIVEIQKISQYFTESINYVKKLQVEDNFAPGTLKWLYAPDNQASIVERHFNAEPDSKFLYLEIPYKFFDDFFTEWLVNKDHGNFTWNIVKHAIRENKIWDEGKFENSLSSPVWTSFKKLGIITPVFNNGETFPKRNTHIIGFTSEIKSDVPVFVKLSDFKKFKLPVISQPFFKGISSFDIDIQNKFINFKDSKNNTIAQYIK